MSIILKALKKAEESKTKQETVRKDHTHGDKTKTPRRTIIAGIAVIVLVISFVGIFLIKTKTVSKPSAKVVSKAVDVKSKPDVSVRPSAVSPKPPIPVEKGPDIAKINADAIVQIKSKHYAAAEGILRKGIALKPDDPVLHNHLGLALKNLFKYKEAAAEYEKAIQQKPDYYEAMNNLAVTYELLGQRGKAKDFYKKALAIKPSYAEAHLNYALLLESEGNNVEAESHYHTFLTLSTDATLKSSVKERLRGIKK